MERKYFLFNSLCERLGNGETLELGLERLVIGFIYVFLPL